MVNMVVCNRNKLKVNKVIIHFNTEPTELFMSRERSNMAKTEVINIRLTDEQKLEIESLAELMQTTRTDLLLKAVAYLKDHTEGASDNVER